MSDALFRTPPPGAGLKRSHVEDLELELRKLQMETELPFLHGWKWYKWAREFFDSTNRINLLCAANQISKSSTQIRKCIDWATDQDKWPTLWSEEVWKKARLQMWYLYPTQKQVNAEFELKWKQFLPKGEMKDDDYYGWKAMKEGKDFIGIEFNNGTVVLFKTYAQKADALQTGSCAAIFCFTAGHQVLTSEGLKDIEDVCTRDKVLTRNGGFEEVVANYSRESVVITRYLSSGEKLEGTPDHRVWTVNRGYVALIDLCSSDVLATHGEWQKEKRKAIKAKFTTVTPGPQTEGTTILQKVIEGAASTYTRLFGSLIGGLFLKVGSYTIRTRTLQTIDFLTWSLRQGLSTPDAINERSGPLALLVSVGRKYAKRVAVFLLRGLLKQPLVSIVHKPVEKQSTWKSVNVLTVALNILLGRTPARIAVLDSVVFFTRKKQVYNLNVKNVHNYYLSGINLANCDEELPIHLYEELMFRITATDGYFHMVFTATLGQEYWRLAMEPEDGEEEVLPEAHKQTVSLYEAMEYEDGSLSHWTLDKIKRVEARCSTNNEVLKRVYGKFIVIGGRKYESFDLKRHKKPAHEIPKNWMIFEAVDIGGGGTSHKAAIVFVAVRPDYRAGRVFLGWRGEEEVTTAGDVFQKHLEMKKSIGRPIQQKWYDWGSKDFGTIAERGGDPFEPAEKSHELGEDVVNTLFKNDMLFIYEDETGELAKLCGELASLKKGAMKRTAKDDFSDALRYCVTKIAWDWSYLTGLLEKVQLTGDAPLTDMQRQIKERREAFDENQESEEYRIQDEFNEWNEYLGN